VDHKSKLFAALKEEGELLSDAGFASGMRIADVHAVDLATASNRNNSLSIELLSGTGTSSRPADSIATELKTTIAQIRSIVTQLPDSASTPRTSFPASAVVHEP
jgi:hypothetical protein